MSGKIFIDDEVDGSETLVLKVGPIISHYTKP